MTREDVKKNLCYIKAFAEGKTIQRMSIRNGYEMIWTDVEDCSFKEGCHYRIKPDPTPRPFKSQEECWAEMRKHEPFAWVKDKRRDQEIFQITCVGISGAAGYTFHEAFENVTFADGKPFGVVEE